MSTSLTSNPINTPARYTVFVDDNFNFMDEDERCTKGSYDDYETAVAVCKGIVDADLHHHYTAGMTADELYTRYTDFGEDPWISPVPESIPRFSAWEYAKHRAEEICGAQRATPGDIADSLDKTNPAPPPDEAATVHRIRAADGLLDLGAAGEALLELKPLHDAAGIQDKPVTSLRVQAMGMLDGPASAGPLALRAVAENRADYATWQNAIIEALNLGRNNLVIRLVERLREWRPEPTSDVWHNLASAQTQLGRHEEALTSILKAVEGGHDPVWCLLDAHLAPLWHHFSEGHLALESAQTLMRPAFTELATAARNERGMRPLCWHTAHLHLPPEIVRHMHRNRFFGFHMSTGAPSGIRRRCLAWLDNRRHRMARVLERAIRRARECVLAEQGQWAADAAARGDWFAVRHHVVLALAERTIRVEECRRHPGLSSAGWMLDGIYDAEMECPGFCKQTEFIVRLIDSGRAREALDKLELLPSCVQTTPLCKMRAASVWTALGVHEKAIQLWVEIVKVWPQEPAAYANLMNAYCKIHQWELATKVMERLPSSFDHLTDADLRRQSVHLRLEKLLRSGTPVKPFCGQPDLGGLVKRLDTDHTDHHSNPHHATGD